MSHRVRLDPVHAADVMRHLAPGPKRRIREALRRLAEDPMGRGSAFDVKELGASDVLPHAFRLRLDDWRVVFLVRGRDVLVMRIFHRSAGYGWMERLHDPGGASEGE